MSKMTEAEWLNGAQLAALLGVTPMTIWRWVRDSKLNFPQPTVIHTRKYWSRNEINEWMRGMATNKANKVAEVA